MSEQLPLFTDLPKIENAIIEFGEIRSPVWTANKAQLVAKYLFYFVMITKHGAYIDGFAAPKDRQNLKGWAADLVLNQEPKFLKEFYLCDIKREGVRILEKLKADHPPRPKRHIEVHHGDFNARVYDILKSDRLKESTATFCLLDQFSFECHWSTVKALAAHKKSGNKIELFYFLCTGWLNRGLKAFKKLEKPEHWWGNADWKSLTAMTSISRAQFVCDRFKNELGYKYAYAWPIYDNGNAGRVMFHMVHATDHPEAPKIMHRAYRNATKAADPNEQNQPDLSTLWNEPE